MAPKGFGASPGAGHEGTGRGGNVLHAEAEDDFGDAVYDEGNGCKEHAEGNGKHRCDDNDDSQKHRDDARYRRWQGYRAALIAKSLRLYDVQESRGEYHDAQKYIDERYDAARIERHDQAKHRCKDAQSQLARSLLHGIAPPDSIHQRYDTIHDGHPANYTGQSLRSAYGIHQNDYPKDDHNDARQKNDGFRTRKNRSVCSA